MSIVVLLPTEPPSLASCFFLTQFLTSLLWVKPITLFFLEAPTDALDRLPLQISMVSASY
jgi:hypothetical protein